ncbi:hypothetical protein MUP65_01005 [Patescibacteria group bacterium]|nr:hypothetical protein [Patescibacteria group bacterium]
MPPDKNLPQVFKQCQENLAANYPHHRLVSGRGELIDHAKAAQHLAQGKIDPKTAVSGPKILAELYQLEIVADNLQDNPHNLTTFLLVNES